METRNKASKEAKTPSEKATLSTDKKERDGILHLREENLKSDETIATIDDDDDDENVTKDLKTKILGQGAVARFFVLTCAETDLEILKTTKKGERMESVAVSLLTKSLFGNNFIELFKSNIMVLDPVYTESFIHFFSLDPSEQVKRKNEPETTIHTRILFMKMTIFSRCNSEHFFNVGLISKSLTEKVILITDSLYVKINSSHLSTINMIKQLYFLQLKEFIAENGNFIFSNPYKSYKKMNWKIVFLKSDKQIDDCSCGIYAAKHVKDLVTAFKRKCNIQIDLNNIDEKFIFEYQKNADYYARLRNEFELQMQNIVKSTYSDEYLTKFGADVDDGDEDTSPTIQNFISTLPDLKNVISKLSKGKADRKIFFLEMPLNKKLGSETIYKTFEDFEKNFKRIHVDWKNFETMPLIGNEPAYSGKRAKDFTPTLRSHNFEDFLKLVNKSLFKCVICPKLSPARRTFLESHVVSHHDPIIFICDSCIHPYVYITRTRQYMDYHQIKEHKNDGNKPGYFLYPVEDLDASKLPVKYLRS